MSNHLNKFTHLYPVKKTSRFALKPIGKTPENLKNFRNKKRQNLLQEDEERAEKYKQAKKIIDQYHKAFIHKRLSTFEFELEDLEQLKKAYVNLKRDNKNDDLKKALKKEQDNLRKKVATQLINKRLFKKEFIKEDLPKWLDERDVTITNIDDPKGIIKEFDKWTTYFSGFNKNRENIYTDKPHSTAIGYRLVHENLPRFLDNIEKYNKAKKLDVDFSEVEQNYGMDLEDIFTLEYFNQCLTQSGIDRYNQIRGGQGKAGNQKDQGVNEKINLFAQQLESQIANAGEEQKKEITARAKAVRSCKLEDLYKQILSDRNNLSFRLENIESDGELCKEIQQLFEVDKNGHLLSGEQVDMDTGEISEGLDITTALDKALKHLDDANPNQLYVKNDKALSNISKYLFGNWTIVNWSLERYAEELYPRNKKKRASWLKNTTYFSFHEIHTGLTLYFEQFSDEELNAKNNHQDDELKGITIEMKRQAQSRPLIKYFKSLKIKKKIEKTNQFEEANLLKQISEAYPNAKNILDSYVDEQGEKLKNKKDEVHMVKAYMDCLIDLYHFLKPLFVRLRKKEEGQSEVYEKDSSFYDDFDALFEVLEQIVPLYNKTRNHLTKKPYSVEKYKLNFENSTLLAGWDKNKEKDNTAVILLKDNKYFLAIMDDRHKNLFNPAPIAETENTYQKMVYKLLPGASKMLPKVFFSARNIANYNPSKDILRIRNHSTHTKNGSPQKSFEKLDFDLTDCRRMIDFFKSSLLKHPEWKVFNFNFSATNSYQSIDEFYREVEHQGYKISYCDIDEDYIHQCIEEGKLYLFEIYSKDFSSHSKGKPNLQTLYWKELFSKRNLKDVVYKLNGKAEIFFRKSSLKYSEEIWQRGHHANDPKKKQEYPIIKDRRYARDTYLFHVPISCNFKAVGVSRFNDRINNFLKNNPEINILGIDRGERHLAYYSLINQKGDILEQGSLNNPQGKKNYHELLDKREKARDKARKSWGTIEKIKDLKTGYLSQVVHKIAKMAVEKNAIILFEDLNFGFKRGRFKVEKQVYQKLEKTLIDKLNYLVFKDVDAQQPGGVLNALQLTAPFESFQKMKKQTGIIYYVPAHYTSKVCPSTGFVNLLYPRYETIKKSQEFFQKFDCIRFNSDAHYFEFAFNYKNFTNKAEGCQQDWIICSHGMRLENLRNSSNNNQWDTREVDLTGELKELFNKYAIDYHDGSDIQQNIVEQDKSEFFKKLLRLLRLTLQLRNSRIHSEEDWMVSPVKDVNGQFFDSRKPADSKMPENADANGAYHIALKGRWVLDQINQSEKGNPNLAITNKEWFKYIQEKPYKLP
jgi:hypothetical protein